MIVVLSGVHHKSFLNNKISIFLNINISAKNSSRSDYYDPFLDQLHKSYSNSNKPYHMHNRVQLVQVFG
jgi:hypothetical protein